MNKGGLIKIGSVLIVLLDKPKKEIMKPLQSTFRYFICPLALALIPCAFLAYMLATPSTIKVANEEILGWFIDSPVNVGELSELQKIKVDELVKAKVAEIETARKNKYSLRTRQANEVFKRLTYKNKRDFANDYGERDREKIAKMVAYEYNLCELPNIKERIECEDNRKKVAERIAHDVNMFYQYDLPLEEIYANLEDHKPEIIIDDHKKGIDKETESLMRIFIIIALFALICLYFSCQLNKKE